MMHLARILTRLTGFAILSISILVSSHAFAAHKGISFQAVLKKPDGTYPNISGLNVTLQVLDPVSECVLREEVHSGINISNGYINLILGSSSASTPTGRNPAVVLTIPQVFDNSTPRTGLNCVDANNNITATGQTYTPTPNHMRKLRLRAVIGADTVVADFTLRAVAFAVNSETLDGKGASSFVQTSAAITQVNVESVYTRYATLDSILNGTFAGNAATATALATAPGACGTGQYISGMAADGTITCGTPSGGSGTVTGVTSANSYLSVATGTTTPVLTVNVGTAANTVAAGNDSRFTDSRAPSGTAGGDLSGSYPNPGVAKISGKSVVLTTPAAGEFLKYDGTNFVNATVPADSTKLPLAGGTMSGAIDMGSQNLTNVGFMTMSANKSLHLSNNASDPSGLASADKGKMWFDSTNGVIRFWNGTTAQSLGVAGSGLSTFNTQTGATQTLAIGTSGTAPAWSSASNTHTLNIPMASTASVTAGLLSKTDYDAFTAKLGTSTSFAGDLTGTYGATSVDKIKGKAVNATTYAAGQTLRYDGTDWVNSVLSFADLGSKPTTLAGYGITDAQSSTLASGKIFVGNASNVATAVTMSGDATLSNAGALTLATVPISKGGTGLTSFTGDKLVTTSAAGALQTSSCGLNQVVSFTAGGAITCASVSSLSSGFIDGGNNFGADASLGNKDNFGVAFKTNNLTRMTILPDGKVGVGVTNPTAAFQVNVATPGDGAVVKGTDGPLSSVTNGTYSLDFGLATGVGYFASIATAGDAVIRTQGSPGGGNLILANQNGSGAIQFSTGSSTTNDTIKMRIQNNGTVGIGVASPAATLDVNGAIKSTAVSNSGTTVDFATGNLQYTSVSCGAITLNNMKSGATYTLAVQGTAGGTCAFTVYSGNGTGALTFKAGPVSMVQTAGKDTLFTFLVMGTTVYAAAIDGY